DVVGMQLLGVMRLYIGTALRKVEQGVIDHPRICTHLRDMMDHIHTKHFVVVAHHHHIDLAVHRRLGGRSVCAEGVIGLHLVEFTTRPETVLSMEYDVLAPGECAG